MCHRNSACVIKNRDIFRIIVERHNSFSGAVIVPKAGWEVNGETDNHAV